MINEDGTDPYVTIPDSGDEDSEKEDDIIKPDDNLVLLGHVEGDASILEVFGTINRRLGVFFLKLISNILFFYSVQRGRGIVLLPS